MRVNICSYKHNRVLLYCLSLDENQIRKTKKVHLNVGADIARVKGADGVRLWPLHQTEVSHGGQLHRQVSERVGSAVDDQHLKETKHKRYQILYGVQSVHLIQRNKIVKEIKK